MSLNPVGHYILVRPLKIEDTDAAYAAASRIKGFEFAGQEKRKEQIAISQGTVLALGHMAYKEMVDPTPWCGKGDVVAYVRHGGMYIKDPDTQEDLLLLNDSDVVALLKKETE
jgi:co-chaperonin GroES (HSP10)